MYCQYPCLKVIFKKKTHYLNYFYYFDKDQRIRVITGIYTLLQNKSGKWSLVQPLPFPDNFRGRQITQQNYLSLQREFIRNSDSFYILEKYYDFVPFREIVEIACSFQPMGTFFLTEPLHLDISDAVRC